MTYAAFLASKRISDPATGFADPPEMPAFMSPHQRDITRWALRRGRAAIFAGTGLGKTLMELVWADRVVTLRKPGENPKPITHGDEYPVDRWQKIASPIWSDINPSDTLQFRAARDDNDERHIAPLQLEVIRRCVELWSAPHDIVLTPFAGIGSELYVAVEMGRRAVGIELKPSYLEQAVRNLEQAESIRGGDLFAAVS